jgi:UDP-N-acetylglucosamine:LPS N-acetylglucosamine transferase
MKKILAVATGGGHWNELVLLSAAFREGQVKYVTTIDGLPQIEGFDDFAIIVDGNKNKKLTTLISVFQLLNIFIKFKPDVVITTGAAAGVVAVFLGKIFRSKTIWVESIANTEQLSLSGNLVKSHVNIMLTQYKHLADGDKLQYQGKIF